MENHNNTETDCGCGSGCCQPKKSNTGRIILLAVIIIAVAAIVTIKLTGKNDSKTTVNCDSTSVKQSECCDKSGLKTVNISDSTKNKSCCPNGKK